MSETIVGSVGVQLVPSAKGFAEKARALLPRIKVPVELELDDKLARTRLDAFTSERRTATVNVDVDTGAAEAKLAGLSKTVGDGRGGGGIFGKLISGAALLSPAMVPLTAAFAGIAGYAGLTAKATADVEKKQKSINQLLHTAATTSSKKTYDASIAQAKALQAGLGGPQKALLGAQGALGKSFNGLVSKAGPALFAPLTAGMTLLATILPHLTPLIVAVSQALTELIDALSTQVANGGLDKFLNFVITSIPPTINFLLSFGGALLNIFKGLAPAGIPLLNLLSSMFGLLAHVPAEVLGPLAAGLIGLFGGPWVAGVVAASVAIGTLYAKSVQFRDFINTMADTVRSNLQPVWDQLVSTWNNQLLPALRESGPHLLDLISKWAIIGSTVARYVLPPVIAFAGFMVGRLLPAMVRFEQFRLDGLIAAFNFWGRAVVTVAQIVGKALGLVLHGIALVDTAMADMLSILGRVPGFGWAKDAANVMRNAAGEANNLADAVSNIPSWHDITIAIHIKKTQGYALATHQKSPKGQGQGVLLPQYQGSNAPKQSGGSSGSSASSAGPKVPNIDLPSFSGGGGTGGGSTKHGGRGSHHGPSAAAQAKKEARQLLDALTAAFKVGGARLDTVLSNIISKITDFPKKFRGPLKEVAQHFRTLFAQLTDLKTKSKDLASTISQAFTPGDLFGGTLGDLNRGLALGLTNVLNGVKAQKLLTSAGVPAAFVTALLSSGNGTLAAQLAANPSLAKGYASQFSQIQSLSNQLGTAQAAATYNPQIDKTNAELARVVAQLKTLDHRIAHEVGAALNGSASTAKRRAKGHR